MKKRIFATLLALTLALGLTVPAAADLPGGTELTSTALTTGTGTLWSYGSSSITADGYVLSSGSYYLGGDVTIDKPLVITGGTVESPVTLDLNGHVLKYNGTDKNSVIAVAQNAYFVMQDTGISEDIHYFTKDTTGLYTLADDTATNTITLTGGIITGGKGTQDHTFTLGGGVFVGQAATFKMTGGSIVGCTTTGGAGDGGGGVYSEGTFNMTGGSIENCTTVKDGGGVCNAFGEFTMSGSSVIEGCIASSGGGVDNLGTFTMKGGTIKKCTATSGGGFNGKTFNMEGGSIKDCTATNGGGVCINGNTFAMKSGTIENCTATNGSGVYICTYIGSGTMDARGGSVYGGVYIDDDKCTLKNDSAAGSTIIYGEITKGTNGMIAGKRITFMNGETTYAETVANENGGKISAPDALTAPEGKTFAGWYTAQSGGTKWEFATGTVSDNMTLYVRWGCPHNGGEWQFDSSGHWKVCTICGEKYDEAAHDGSPCAVCGYAENPPIRRQNTTAVEDTTTTTETKADEAKADTVTSAKTFDAGVAVYGAMAVASLLGMGYVGKKRV